MSRPLIAQFKSYFDGFDESITQNLFLVCSAIILARTTNLSVLKDYLPQLLSNSKTQSASHYKRLIRFFRLKEPDKLVKSILKLIFQLLDERIKYLVLDATTWQIGKKKVQLLTLCIIYRNIAIPIFWHQLNKKGHSSEDERESLIRDALALYHLKGKILLADREYVGEKWLAYLSKSDIDFVIRMSETCYKVPISAATGFAYSKLQKQVHKRKRGVIKSFLLNGCNFSAVLLKNPKPDPEEPILYFVSSLTNKVHITEAYRIRWKIENCFKHLKTNGFNIEDLNFKADGKINLIMGIVVMSYVLTIQQAFKNTSSKIKKYKNGTSTLAVSFFRLGLGQLRRKVQSLRVFLKYLEIVFQTLFTPQWLNVQ